MHTTEIDDRQATLAAEGKLADWTPEYDAAGESYDSVYSEFIGKQGAQLVAALGVEPGNRVLELGCGTGFLTLEVAEQLNGRGEIVVTDTSMGMLGVARGKFAELEGVVVETHNVDMLSLMRQTASASVDVVLCGWAICYTDPSQFFQEAARVLRPGGVVGVIESAADAFNNVNDAYAEVLKSDPSFMTKAIHLNLPTDVAAVEQWMADAGLEPTSSWSGSEAISFDSPESMLLWMNAGAQGAGYLDAIDEDRLDDFIDRMLARLRTNPEMRLVHTFVAAVARRRDG